MNKEHRKNVKKLSKLESRLISLITEPLLMQAFLDWQNQRIICNEGFNLLIRESIWYEQTNL